MDVKGAVLASRGVLEQGAGRYATLEVVLGDAPALCSDTPVRLGEKIVRLEFASDANGVGPGLYRTSGTADWGPGRVFGYMHHVDKGCEPDGPGAGMLPESTIELLDVTDENVLIRVHIVLGIGYGVVDGEFPASRCSTWSAIGTPDGDAAAVRACKAAL
jgi:hypothetical protein